MYPTDDFHFDTAANIPDTGGYPIDHASTTSDDVNYDAGTSPDSAPIE